MFLAYFNTDGQRIRATYYGGADFDTGYRLFQNVDGNIWLTGHTRSTSGLSTMGTFQPMLSGGLDAFVSEFDLSARLLRSTYFGGTSNEESFGLVVHNNSVFISGKTTSSNRIAFGNAFQKDSGGGDDGFITKFGCTPLNINIISNSSTLCQGALLQLNTNQGSSYQWSGPGGFNATVQNPPPLNNVQPEQSGVYSVTVTDNSGCTGSDTISIVVNAQPLVMLSSNSPVCEGDEIRILLTGGLSFLWSGPSSFISTSQNPVLNDVKTTQSGIYRVSVTGSNGCIKIDSINVTVRNQININVTSNSPVCQGDTVRLSATTGNTFIWTGPAGYSSTLRNPSFLGADITRSGNYILTVSDSAGCTATKNVNVLILPKPIAEIAGIDTVCLGNQITLVSSGIGNRLWSTGNTSQQISVNPLQNTTYTLILNQNGCRDTAEFKVIVIAPPEIEITLPLNLIELGTSVQISAKGASTYIWEPAFILSCSNCSNPMSKPENTIEICVAGFNSFGCRTDTCMIIVVKNPCDIILPNIISPNNDLYNNSWCSLAKECIKEQYLEIYDRWGNKIYSSSGTEVCWNPENESVKLQNQVLTYILKITLSDGNEKIETGNITVVK